jgi:hypothetical protein
VAGQVGDHHPMPRGPELLDDESVFGPEVARPRKEEDRAVASTEVVIRQRWLCESVVAMHSRKITKDRSFVKWGVDFFP